MTDPFLSEIALYGFNFAPRGWATCSGQILPINQNQALFSLLGTTYGGNGQTTFALPDLRGRVPVHRAPSLGLGSRGGEEHVTLTEAQLAPHAHAAAASGGELTTTRPAGRVPARGGLYGPPAAGTVRAPESVDAVGGGQPHANMPPYLALNFCIALQGIFPSPS